MSDGLSTARQEATFDFLRVAQLYYRTRLCQLNEGRVERILTALHVTIWFFFIRRELRPCHGLGVL